MPAFDTFQLLYFNVFKLEKCQIKHYSLHLMAIKHTDMEACL